MKKIILLLSLVFICVCSFISVKAEELRYEFTDDNLVNAGWDTGYSKNNPIDESDWHYGWRLGYFYVEGFTRKTENTDGTPIFLKTVSDTISFHYKLEQDINNLQMNNNKIGKIFEDNNGYDIEMGLEKQNFGRGMLIIKKVDYQNRETKTLYANFLESCATETANTEIDIFEEGDYEIVLDYEIDKASGLFGARW